MTRSGRELADWAGMSVPAKLDAVYKRYPGTRLSFSGALNVVYRDASEVLHGTLYGVALFWEPRLARDGLPRSFEDVYVYDHLMTIFSSTSASVRRMLEVIAEGYDLAEVQAESEKLLRESSTVMASLLSRLGSVE